MIPQQQAHPSYDPPLQCGFIFTNANCSATGPAISLHALEKTFGPIEACIVTTMQAISGAGYSGVPNLDVIDSVVPYIGVEEGKMEWETLKIRLVSSSPLPSPVALTFVVRCRCRPTTTTPFPSHSCRHHPHPHGTACLAWPTVPRPFPHFAFTITVPL